MAGESGESANKVKKRSEKNRAAADSKESLATFSFLCTENTKKAAASKDKLFRPSRYPGSRYVLSPCLRARPWNIWSREWELNPRPADYESAALPLSYLGPLKIKDLFKASTYLPSNIHQTFIVLFQ